jgi:hypothetical protein
VWGPYFFEDDDVIVTVTSDRYCAMLENFLRPKLDDLFDEHGAEKCGFNKMVQQTTHLGEMFPEHAVYLRGDNGWPPRSPDLTPCNFSLWATSKPRYTNIVP